MKPLTARELECLHWAAMGKTSWEIGMILGVAERTVNFHIRNATDKFQVRGRQAAIAMAYRTGLLPARPSLTVPSRPTQETRRRPHQENRRQAP